MIIISVSQGTPFAAPAVYYLETAELATTNLKTLALIMAYNTGLILEGYLNCTFNQPPAAQESAKRVHKEATNTTIEVTDSHLSHSLFERNLPVIIFVSIPFSLRAVMFLLKVSNNTFQVNKLLM